MLRVILRNRNRREYPPSLVLDGKRRTGAANAIGIRSAGSADIRPAFYTR